MSISPLEGQAQTADDFLTEADFARVDRVVRPAAPRYRNVIGKYSIRRAATCQACGRCVDTCRYDVHRRPQGYDALLRPLDYRCVGPACATSKSRACTSVPAAPCRSPTTRPSRPWATAAGRPTCWRATG